MDEGVETTAVLHVRFGRAMYAPLVPLVALLTAVATGADAGGVALLLLALLVTLGVATLTAFSHPVEVRGQILSVCGREQVARGPGGTVDLGRLSRARSVSYRGGLLSGRGLALFRTQIELQDEFGQRAMFGAWGWTPKREFQAVLRRAVADSHARMDPMTWWRLGFRNDQGVRVSPLRRFI
ncbi:hypothetical protein [Nocardioides panacihumi]|uniref:hypothetical protein n=1 Tax=Nocardioides panacihumi TaxID=400774 RepID=UPI0031D8CF2D